MELDNREIACIASATINTIVDAIDRNGLEKTVEDLREHYIESKHKTNEATLRGMLSEVKEFN